MARPARSRNIGDGACNPQYPLLDHYLYNYHSTHSPLHAVLHKPNLHHELYHIVSLVPRSKGNLKLRLPRMLIVLAFASTVSWIVRYRYLNMYARLPPEPQRKEPQIDLFPDTQDGDSKPGLANYLDEFLSAIKVFGYRKRMHRFLLGMRHG